MDWETQIRMINWMKTYKETELWYEMHQMLKYVHLLHGTLYVLIFSHIDSPRLLERQSSL